MRDKVMLAICFGLGWVALAFMVGAVRRDDELMAIVWFGLVAGEAWLVSVFARRIAMPNDDDKPDLDTRTMLIVSTIGALLFAVLAISAALDNNMTMAYTDALIFVGLSTCVGFLSNRAQREARESGAIARLHQAKMERERLARMGPEDDQNWSSYAAEIRSDGDWKPGDPCGQCGSTRTVLDPDPTIGARCLSCGACDDDE